MNAKLLSLSLIPSLEFLFSPSLCPFYLFTCQRRMHCRSTFVLVFLPHRRFIFTRAVFFSERIVVLFHVSCPLSFLHFPSSPRVTLPCSSSDTSHNLLPLPVVVLEGHSWYNYSFWLSSRLTPGWPGPDAAAVCQPLTLLQLMRDAQSSPQLADSLIYCPARLIPAAAFLCIRKR